MTTSRAFSAVLMLCAATAGAQNPLAELRAAAGHDAAVAALQAPRVRPSPKNPGRDDGRETAGQACSQAAFSSDREACIRVVSSARYFDVAAVAVCRRVNFSSEVPQCISAIANKSYLRAETELCGKESFGSGIISCFQASGRPTRGGGQGDEYTLRQLRRIARLLRDGYYRDAMRELDDLIEDLERTR